MSEEKSKATPEPKISAYLFINTETGGEGEAVKNMRKVKGVINAYEVYGVYDAVVKVEVDGLKGLRESVAAVKRTGYVRNVATSIAIG